VRANTSLAATACGGAHTAPGAVRAASTAECASLTPRYFRTRAEFRRWLRSHHARARELLVGFHKKTSGVPSLSWPESVEEALCFGWIDGVRRRLDTQRYSVRFTPRGAGSIWSAVNVRKARALSRAGRMASAGRAAFAARRPSATSRYSYEQRPAELIEPYAGRLRRAARAWRFFHAQIPSYRRAATWWVISAKQEQTRARRRTRLIELSARAQLLPQFLPRR
jgi:uncharacterized protein YdeI (YjbR/CyaY-like superfamily)